MRVIVDRGAVERCLPRAAGRGRREVGTVECACPWRPRRRLRRSLIFIAASPIKMRRAPLGAASVAVGIRRRKFCLYVVPQTAFGRQAGGGHSPSYAAPDGA